MLYVSSVAVILFFMNTYPLSVSRDLIFSSKQVSLQSQAAVVATSLSALDPLSSDNIGQVIELLDLSGLTQIAVIGPEYEALFYISYSYNTEFDDSFTGNVDTALAGNDVFHSVFSDGAFSSSTFTPIMRKGAVVGIVHLNEYDVEQGSILLDLQNSLKNISLAVGIIIIALILLIVRLVTRRYRQILDAITNVREGQYSYRISVSGADELANLSDEFNSLTDRLQHTEELRRRFVADASHELKTPLASIKLLSDSILQNDSMGRDMVYEFVRDIGIESERLARTTEKLLGLSRFDNDIAIQTGPVDLTAVVTYTLKMLEPVAQSSMISITHSLDEDCTVWATEDDLHQVVFNLIENAIKYNISGGSVDVDLSEKNHNIILTVDDTGSGIPEEDLPYVFDRFYRVDKARSREAGGSGLGLSIAQEAVLRFNGSINAMRRDEGGMRFCVSFPQYFISESDIND